jgi:hypothetical protein
MGGSGGNFDKVLFIDQNGHISPSGPLDPSLNTMKEVYAWVIQMRNDGSAAHISEQELAIDPSVTRWTTSGSDKVSNHGRFEPGPAVALALGVAVTPDGETNLSWWSEAVSVQWAGSKSSTSTS